MVTQTPQRLPLPVRSPRRPGLAASVAVMWAACLAAALWFATQGPPPVGSAAEVSVALSSVPAVAPSPGQLDYAELESRIATLMQDPNMVGLAVGTIEGGRVRFVRGYGETLAGSGAPVTPDTVFRWASLSKGVAAALVVTLAETGRLSLDTPLATIGTTLKLPGGTARVTPADVLSHRLGLVRNAWDDRLEAGADPKLLRAELATLAPYCAPGACYTYQNVAFDTATEIVERVAGRDYAGFATDRLFAPLGMTNASIGRAGLQGATSWAQPHRRGRQPTVVEDSYYRVPAAGGVNSSIRDLLRWMQAQMGAAPDVLSPAALALMHRPRVDAPPNGRRGPMERALAGAAYGLGWRSYSYAGHMLVGHRGSVDGYGSLILFDPALQSGIVMLWNSNFSPAARLQLEFFDRLYGLPPTDWLALPDPAAVPATPPAVTIAG